MNNTLLANMRKYVELEIQRSDFEGSGSWYFPSPNILLSSAPSATRFMVLPTILLISF